MRIGSVRGCIIRIHPFFIFMLIFLCIGGAAWPVAAFLITLILHETAHFLCAVLMRLSVAQIELTPFGGSMQIPLIEALPAKKAFFLSCAGPLCNLIFLLFSLLISSHLSCWHPFLLRFIQCNAVMLCINLLPVLPLDGGRMLLAFLSKHFGRSQIMRIFLIFSRTIALLLILTGLFLSFRGTSRFSFSMLGIYLLYSAAIEEKTSVSRYLAAFMARRLRFEKQKTLPVHTLCASASLPVFMLIGHLHPGAYHIIEVVLEDSFRPIGQIREEKLLSCILDHSCQTLSEIISPN